MAPKTLALAVAVAISARSYGFGPRPEGVLDGHRSVGLALVRVRPRQIRAFLY